MPEITQPILFNTPQADRILAALQVFPADNPWNTDVSQRPLHPNSKNIIASMGTDKPFRYNPDMSFILVPPDQKKIGVHIVSYPDESDKGPFPIPDDLPIEGGPADYKRTPALRGLSLDDVQRDRRNRDGDRHALVIDPVNRVLYEFYQAKKTERGWQAAQASVFDLKTNRLRPAGWTDCRISTGPLKGTNNKIRTMLRQAYVFRDKEFFKPKIYALHVARYALTVPEQDRRGGPATAPQHRAGPRGRRARQRSLLLAGVLPRRQRGHGCAVCPSQGPERRSVPTYDTGSLYGPRGRHIIAAVLRLLFVLESAPRASLRCRLPTPCRLR